MKYQLCFMLSFLLLLSCGGSEPEQELSLFKGEPEQAYHKANVGSIFFMDKWIPSEEIVASNNLSQVVLKEGGEFFLRLLPAHTQTYYLHQLDTSLSVNESCKIGNWNVRFFVDDQQVYEDNLNPGSGSCWNRNEVTSVGVPLVAKKENYQKHWGSYLWKRFFYKEGNEKRFLDGPHKLTMEFRPYLKQAGKFKVGEVVAAGSVQLSLKEIEVPEQQLAVQTIRPAEGWQIADQNFDKTGLREVNRKIASKRYKNVTSILAIYEGKLLVEQYYKGASRERLHDPRSVGKSFVATLMGQAIAQGHIKNENQKLSEFYKLDKYKNRHPEKGNISLKELLMMASCLEGNDMDMKSPGNEENMYPTDDWIKFTLDLPVDEKKLKAPKWEYMTAGSVLLGGILHQNIPGGLEAFASKELFEPLGISKFKWQYTPTGVVNTAGSLQLRTLDYGKYGQLHQQKGQWKGKQIVPSDWVEACLSPQINRSDNPKEGYGYQFWTDVITHDDKEYPYSYAAGNGGNLIAIFKDLPLVVVITATAYGDVMGHLQAKEILSDYLLPLAVSVK